MNKKEVSKTNYMFYEYSFVLWQIVYFIRLRTGTSTTSHSVGFDSSEIATLALAWSYEWKKQQGIVDL